VEANLSASWSVDGCPRIPIGLAYSSHVCLVCSSHLMLLESGLRAMEAEISTRMALIPGIGFGLSEAGLLMQMMRGNFGVGSCMHIRHRHNQQILFREAYPALWAAIFSKHSTNGNCPSPFDFCKIASGVGSCPDARLGSRSVLPAYTFSADRDVARRAAKTNLKELG
jgi:hypothetical protein